MAKILRELDKMVGDEEEASIEKAAKGEEENSVDDIIKHIEAVEAAANYVDGLTPGNQDDEVAFDAEVALRKALSKMRELSDDVYKDTKNDEKETEEGSPPSEEV